MAAPASESSTCENCRGFAGSGLRPIGPSGQGEDAGDGGASAIENRRIVLEQEHDVGSRQQGAQLERQLVGIGRRAELAVPDRLRRGQPKLLGPIALLGRQPALDRAGAGVHLGGRGREEAAAWIAPNVREVSLMIYARVERYGEATPNTFAGSPDEWVWAIAIRGSFEGHGCGGYQSSPGPCPSPATTEMLILDNDTGAFLESWSPAFL
jgi:hypothetical protein